MPGVQIAGDRAVEVQAADSCDMAHRTINPPSTARVPESETGGAVSRQGFTSSTESSRLCKTRRRLPGLSAEPSGLQRSSAELLKTGQGVRFVVFDIEQFVELRDREDFVDFRPDVAELQFAAVRFDFLVQRDQLAQRGAGKKLDGREIEQQILALSLLRSAGTALGRVPEYWLRRESCGRQSAPRSRRRLHSTAIAGERPSVVLL